MSTHTTHFCDCCNYDRETSSPGDDTCAITYSEYPTGDGWAVFQEPYTDSLGYRRQADVHICAHCLASLDFEPRSSWSIPDWDNDSRENFERGRKHADMFDQALDAIGTRDRFGRRGVWQVFGESAYGYCVGPKLADGRFRTSDAVYERAA